MCTGGGWPGLFGSLVDSIVQSYRARYAERFKAGSVVVLGITSEKSNFLLNTTDLDNQYFLLHPVVAFTYCPG